MIETTLRTSFVPGTNVRGEVTGANWTFLLPTLELDRAVCLGAPGTSALKTLIRLARHVTVVAGPEERRRVRAWAEEAGVTGVEVADPADRASLPPADLVWVLDGDDGSVEELVAPGGSVYHERRARRRDRGLALHLTPFGGEMRTAVPLADAATSDWFAAHGLRGSTVDVRTLKGLLGRSGRAGGGAGSGGDGDGTGGARRGLARRAGQTVLDLVGAAEGVVARSAWLRGRLGRQAVLVRPDGEDRRPPRWLRELADGFGVDLAGCRWGLAALGNYSSRKVLFFLWPGDAPAGAPPGWVVKLTRDPALNGRLENLVRALDTLHRIPGIDAAAVPRAAFHGHHAGLAVVGESTVAGGPFAGRSAWSPECPVAGNAVRWLTDLAAATVRPTPASEVAGALRRLFDEFAGIYDLRPDERAFLTDQIDGVAASGASFPLVFQHGDPGTWNLFADDAGRVAFLDWEAAEPEGIPLWDLFYFWRSFAVGCARRGGAHDRLAAIESELYGDASTGGMLVAAVRDYCGRVGLAPGLVEPLFHTCWMHRALKEATRLPVARLSRAHYLALLRLGIARRGAPTLRRLFGR